MQEGNPDFHLFVYSKEVLVLVKAANDTASFFEELKGMQATVFISKAVKHLSGVYSSILMVGETEPINEAAGDPTVTEQDWSALFQRIAQLLGTKNEILRPAEEDEFDRSELVTHAISEDLSDVYQELRDFTTIL